jgi:putative acyl-CoA dehydrogenase
MKYSSSHANFFTHDVSNQATPLENYNAYQTDIALQQAVARDGSDFAANNLTEMGALVGGELITLGQTANINKPTLRTFDRFGHRIDQVEFHPAYHRLMQLGIAHGVPNFAWRNEVTSGAHVARAALMYLFGQAEQGTLCPMTMTYASVPALRQHSAIAERWLPRILSTQYDLRFIAPHLKTGCTIGMGMTEKQGGSDVRANTTKAHAISNEGAGEYYELVGHKWFLSAPMCDAFLVLAQSPRGLSCFLLPRILDNGDVNAIRIQRLKDKLGDWSNASSEVEFHGATAQMLGEEGRGIATILEMVALTRQDCIIGSASIMRSALVQAIHHARQRKAFGKLLIEQPLMQNVLADLALESEAAMLFAMRVARAVDRSHLDAHEAAFARVATAIGKYWICKRTPALVNEAQEALGGAGYVEESILPRLYRQAPLNSIWEGSGNIQCLDVLRALAREPETRDALYTEFAITCGQHALLDDEVVAITRELAITENLELRSRSLVERLAVALQAGLMLRGATDALARDVANSFCRSRLGNRRAIQFGTLDANVPMAKILEHAFTQ